MKKIKFVILSICLLLILVSTSCQSTGLPANPTSATPDIPISTKIPTPTQSPLFENLPDILINIGTSSLPECIWEGTSQVWVVRSPFESAEVLLADPKIHYFFPTWSPNGEWLAYVETQISHVVDGTPEPGPQGTDSIWIMKLDGTQKRRVSDYFPRFDYQHGGSCLMGHSIVSTPIWSPNGKYMFFSYFGPIFKNYLADVETGVTKLISEGYLSLPLWIADNQLLFTLGKEAQIITINAANNLATQEIPNVQLEENEELGSFPTLAGNKYIIVESYNETTGKTAALWQLELGTNTWSKFLNKDMVSWFRPQAVDNILFACDRKSNKQIVFIDGDSLEIIGLVNIPGSSPNTCGVITSLDNFKDAAGDDLISFGGDDGEIWVGRIQTREEAPKLLFDHDSLNFPNNYSYIIAYDWKR